MTRDNKEGERNLSLRGREPREGSAVHLCSYDARTSALVIEQSVLKLGGDSAVGTSEGQPGKTPPYDQPHQIRQSDSKLQYRGALHDGDVSRTAGVVSAGPRAGQRSGSCIGRGGQAVARGGAGPRDPRGGIGKRAETTAALFHGENGGKSCVGFDCSSCGSVRSRVRDSNIFNDYSLQADIFLGCSQRLNHCRGWRNSELHALRDAEFRLG